MREMDPSKSHSLLEEAGLSHLQTAVLNDFAPPIVRTSELARLYGAVFRSTGEALTRLFLGNYARRMAPMLLKHPEVVKLSEQRPAIHPVQVRAWTARALPQLLNAIWATVELREDDAAFYLEVEQCPICVHMHGTTLPICHSSEYLYTAFARAISGQRLTLSEVACRAQGKPACSFRLEK
jgi:hypothetical protein